MTRPPRTSDQTALIRRQAEHVLSRPPRERLGLLLRAARPMRLVRSLPAGELYLTVREAGPADAVPLLALAAPEQILHLMDLEAWRGDRFDSQRTGAWVALLLEAGEPTLRGFLRRADDALLALLLHRWLRVEPIETDDDPHVHGTGESEAGDERGFVSPDGNYRFSPEIAEHGPASQLVLRVFLADQPDRYRHVIWSSRWELPSQLEEEALRWRQARLEEQGFVPRDEALEIYAPPAGDRAGATPEAPSAAAPRSALTVLAPGDPAIVALERLEESRREAVLHELAALANRVLVADSVDLGDPDLHRSALAKTGGYIRIALERRGVAEDSASAARVIEQVSLVELFREGHAPVARLRASAVGMLERGWAATDDRALDFLDSPLRERVLGLLETRPLYVDLDAGPGPEAMRDFRTHGEVEETARAVRLAVAIGNLFVRRLGLAPETFAGPDRPHFSALLMTTLAWHFTGGELRHEPLPRERVADFLRGAISRGTAAPDAVERAWEALLSELLSRRMLDRTDAALIDGFARACIAQLSAECASLDPGTPLDPRFVSTLLVGP